MSLFPINPAPTSPRRIRDVLTATPDSAGLFVALPEALPEIAASSQAQGFNLWTIELDNIGNADGLLAKIGEALHFPDWYGRNWDALADCLSDLSWCDADGHVLVLQGCTSFAEKAPRAFDTLQDLLGEVSQIWRTANIGFWVFIDAPRDGLPVVQ